MFIVKVPGVNSGGNTEGCERAGNAILSALKKGGYSENGKVIDPSLLDLEEIHLNNNNLELTNKLIYENSYEIFEEKPRTIFLGGDHSISYSIVTAFLKNCQSRGRHPCLIVFDSHPNCEPINSASKFPSNNQWLRGIIEKGFPPENILLAGVRNMSSQELIFLKEKKVRMIGVNQIIENIEETCEVIMEFSDGKDLYLSIDIGVVDPAFAPSTDDPEPGGLTSRQFLYLIQRINKIRNLRAADLVEINEKKDKGMVTVKLGAKILSEMI